MTKEALGKGRAAIFEGLNQPQATIDKPPVTSDKLPATIAKAKAIDQQPDTSYQSPAARSMKAYWIRPLLRPKDPQRSPSSHPKLPPY